MLQNPSKYHTNPLSHFLALHNSQATHNGIGVTGVSNVQPHTAVAAAAAAAAAVAATGQSSYHNASSVLANQQQQQHHHHQHNHHHHQQQHNPQQNAHNRQQQQQHAHTQSHQQAAATATAVAVAAHQHHLQQQSSATSHAQIIDTAHTSLDVGKSFTIAAILGLQKSAIEHQRKEYNNAINLSLNGGSCGGISSDEDIKEHTNLNNNNDIISNNNNTSHNSIKVFANNSFGNSVNNFNCDSSNSGIGSIALVNRYLPTAPNNGNVAASFVAHHHHQQQQQQQHQQQQQNVRANSFAAAAAVAAAAAASAAPSALQSLQQLHQQHAQQATLSFQREKLKAETSKKNSLKNKRVRTIFTPEQLERLEAEFERQQYMVGPERLYLAHTLQLTEAQVKVWFQNRRIKWRKHHLEITQQRLALIRQSQLPSAGVNVGGDGGNTLATLTAATTTSSITAASTPSIEDNEDSKHDVDLHPLSGAGSESDLSICNDSLDGDSIIDGNGEDT